MRIRISFLQAREKGDSRQEAINLINDVSELVISVRWGQFEFEDQAVNLVDADGDGQTFLHGVLQKTLRVQHHLKRDGVRQT